MNLREVVEDVANRIRNGKLSDDDVLDMWATVDSKGSVQEVGLLVAYGGPTVWVEITPTDIAVKGSWSGEEHKEVITNKELAEELFNRFASSFEGLTIRL